MSIIKPSAFRRYTNESHPLVVDPEVANKIGLNESIVIRQLHYWLLTNEKNKKNIHDGQVWCYQTITEWREQFPFWSESTIKRIFAELSKLHLTKVISNPRNSWDKTNWYTINYTEYAKLFEANNSDLIDQVKMTPSIVPNWSNRSGHFDLIITNKETNKETKEERGEVEVFSQPTTQPQNQLPANPSPPQVDEIPYTDYLPPQPHPTANPGDDEVKRIVTMFAALIGHLAADRVAGLVIQKLGPNYDMIQKFVAYLNQEKPNWTSPSKIKNIKFMIDDFTLYTSIKSAQQVTGELDQASKPAGDCIIDLEKFESQAEVLAYLDEQDELRGADDYAIFYVGGEEHSHKRHDCEPSADYVA